MPVRLGRHYSIGGLFLVEGNRVLKELIRPTGGGWDDDALKVWLDHKFSSEQELLTYMPIPKDLKSFEFKGKTYVYLGLTEDGFRRIRSTDNINTDSRDTVLEWHTGEEEDARSDS